MIITYHGAEFVKVQFGDIILAFNPVSKNSKLSTTKFGADVALVSVKSPDMDGIEQVSFGEKKPFLINGPGEYEVREVYIRGFSSKSKYGGDDRLNTIYLVNLEGMNLCFLGAIDGDLPTEANEAIDDVDILFLPIGGSGVLDPAKANKMAVSIEPKIIIPIHYGNMRDKDALKRFLKESGDEGIKPIDKLTIKKKDLEGKEGDIVVLESNQ